METDYFLDESMNHLIYKMLKMTRNTLYSFLKPEVTSSDCLFLSHQQSETWIYSVYYYKRQRKAENPHNWEAGNRNLLAFLLEKWPTVAEYLFYNILIYFTITFRESAV